MVYWFSDVQKVVLLFFKGYLVFFFNFFVADSLKNSFDGKDAEPFCQAFNRIKKSPIN